MCTLASLGSYNLFSLHPPAFATHAIMSGIMDGHATAQPTSWMTSRRLRAHGLILALVLWSTYAWILAVPGLLDRNGLVKGTDFLHYYILGSLAREHRGADLYDMAGQSKLAQRLVPQAGRLFYVPLYGPQVSLLFAPLSALPYGWALSVWFMANAAIYAVCCYAVWRTCPRLRSDGLTVMIAALAYPAFFHLIAWGQTSALALACFTLAYLALCSGRMLSAGLAIGCLIFKPQLGLAAAFVFLLAQEWKVVFGAVAAAVAQLSTGWLYYGTSVMQDYLRHLTRVRDIFPQLEPRPYQMHSLRSFWDALVPWPHVAIWLYVATALVILSIAVLCWRSAPPVSLRFSALLIATVLASPHLTVYDLLILAPAFLLLTDWALGNSSSERRVGPLLYLCYALPLIGPLAQWTHVQLSVPALAVLLWTIFRISKEAARSAPLQPAAAT
jgi:alpha-1,2-mannosyltransferase